MFGNYLGGENDDRSRPNANPLKVLFALGARSVVAGLDESARQVGAMGPTYELLKRGIASRLETDGPQENLVLDWHDKDDRNDGEEGGDEGRRHEDHGGQGRDVGGNDKGKGRANETKAAPQQHQSREGAEGDARKSEDAGHTVGRKRPAPIEILEPPSVILSATLNH